jgi:CHAD domain-containing protein
MGEWTVSEDGRVIVRVLVRGLVHVAREEIAAAETSVRRARLEDDLSAAGSIRQLRVAIRRIEYQLATMAEVDPTLGADDLIKGLHEVGKPFGQLRDAEILSARVAKVLRPRGVTPESDRLLEAVADERYRAQRTSDGWLDSEEFHRTLEDLNDFRLTLPTDAVSPAMARPVAQHAIRVTWRSVKRAAKAAKEESNDELLHALRRKVKHAVYLTRGFSYVLGPSSEEFALRLVTLQKLLGRQHDHVVVAAWLQGIGGDYASLKPLTDDVSLEERRRADNNAEEWAQPWQFIRDFRPKETVMTSYSFFD